MSGDLVNQIIARIVVIVVGFGIAWVLAKGVALVAPSWETWVFAGFAAIWLVGGVRGLIREIQFQRARSN